MKTAFHFGIVLCVTGAMAAAQRPRVTAGAADIRHFQLTEDHLRRLAAVTQAMGRLPSRGPEAPRADAAVFGVLSMSLPFNEPFTEKTVPRTVGLIQQGHYELANAIQSAGLTIRDYVLTQITLILTAPIVAAERQGHKGPVPDDVSPGNLAVVRANWPEIEKTLRVLMPQI